MISTIQNPRTRIFPHFLVSGSLNNNFPQLLALLQWLTKKKKDKDEVGEWNSERPARHSPNPNNQPIFTGLKHGKNGKEGKEYSQKASCLLLPFVWEIGFIFQRQWVEREFGSCWRQWEWMGLSVSLYFAIPSGIYQYLS